MTTQVRADAQELAARMVEERLLGFGLPALDNTYGALFLGMAFGLILYGLTCHQTYRYFRLYPEDKRMLFWLVIVIWVLDTFHTICTLAACYWHLVTNYFDPFTLLDGHWSTRLITPTSGLVIFVGQFFYAHRVWYLGPQFRYLVFVAGVLMVALLGFTTAATVEGFLLPLSEFKSKSWIVSAMIGVALLTDFIVTSILIYVLLKSRTGLKKTDSTIETIVLYSVNTGLLNTIFALLGFIFAIILPGNLIYIGISIVSTKLYANSVLAVLNSRRSLSARMMAGTFELGGSGGGAATRPHTDAEVWDIPQFAPGGTASSTVVFAHQTGARSTYDSSTAASGNTADVSGFAERKEPGLSGA